MSQMIPVPRPNVEVACPECNHRFYMYSTKDVDFWPKCADCGATFHVKVKMGQLPEVVKDTPPAHEEGSTPPAHEEEGTKPADEDESGYTLRTREDIGS